MKDEFIKYVKEQFGYDINFKKSNNPDSFEKIFKVRKNRLITVTKSKEQKIR